jgi:hypothetical protein
MARTALEEVSYEKIKAHVLEPDQSPLNVEQKQMLDRVVSVAKVLDKNPVQKHAIALHMKKHPDIGRTRAHLDVKLAIRLFNTLHNFDFDFWQTWLVNDIVANINRVRSQMASANNDKQLGALSRVVAMEHANLVKAIGERPPALNDPRLTEKHEYYILVNKDGENVKIDLNKVHQLPQSTISELNRALFAGKEIEDVQAQEIMKT